jgi:HlyD family secretion protein
MRPQVRIVLAAVAIVAIGAALWFAWAPRGHAGRVLSGYVEGETLYMSAPGAGPVSSLAVARGQRVRAGQPLFALDAAQLAGRRDAAAAAVAAAQAQAADVRKGQRPDELAVYDAERAAAQAQLSEAAADLARVRTLTAKGIFAPARLDQAQAAYNTALANVRTVTTRKQVGTLGARPDAIRAADAAVQQARGNLADAQNRLDQISPAAPADALVEDVFFQKGEWAGANQPVVALLPDSRVRLRFFVPEKEIALYRAGTRVRFSCDGCRGNLAATVNFVSQRPEFTPPVIYSRGARDRLVYMVEALPDAPRALSAGQPVDVTPVAGTGRP